MRALPDPKGSHDSTRWQTTTRHGDRNEDLYSGRWEMSETLAIPLSQLQRPEISIVQTVARLGRVWRREGAAGMSVRFIYPRLALCQREVWPTREVPATARCWFMTPKARWSVQLQKMSMPLGEEPFARIERYLYSLQKLDPINCRAFWNH